MKALLTMMILLAALALLPACEDDPVFCLDCGGIPPQIERMPLTSRTAILNNIEYAYKTRRGDVIGELLHNDFVFFFAPGDVGGGIPVSWGRDEEYETTSALFESNEQPEPPNYPVCRSIRLDLQFDDATEWAPMVPASAPTETWYTATVFYSYTFEMEPDNTYIAQNGAQSQFTVRQVGDEWRLVDWRDLGASIVMNATESGAAVSEKTWGSIKSLYR